MPVWTFSPGGGIKATIRMSPGAGGAIQLTTDDGLEPVNHLTPHPGRRATYWAQTPGCAGPGGYCEVPADVRSGLWIQGGTEVYRHQEKDEFLYSQVYPLLQAVPAGQIDGLTLWPSSHSMARMCASQGRRLKYGAGFVPSNDYNSSGGCPELLWTEFFVPGPLGGVEPQWASLTDQAIEELCAQKNDAYVLERWRWIREAFLSPPVAYEPTALDDYLRRHGFP